MIAARRVPAASAFVRRSSTSTLPPASHATTTTRMPAMAALAGMLAAPISSVFPNMGSHVLIISFVIVVIGGIGSVWGALIAALIVGFADTFGKVLIPELSGIVVYVVMAVVLLWRPEGILKKG